VKGPRGDEENKVCIDVTVLGGNGAALNERKQVPLHTLTAGIGAPIVSRADELVYLVDEHDAGLLHRGDGFLGNVVVIEHSLGLALRGWVGLRG